MERETDGQKVTQWDNGERQAGRKPETEKEMERQIDKHTEWESECMIWKTLTFWAVPSSLSLRCPLCWPPLQPSSWPAPSSSASTTFHKKSCVSPSHTLSDSPSFHPFLTLSHPSLLASFGLCQSLNWTCIDLLPLLLVLLHHFSCKRDGFLPVLPLII